MEVKMSRADRIRKTIAERKAKGLKWGRAAGRDTAIGKIVDEEVEIRISKFKERARKRIEKALSRV